MRTSYSNFVEHGRVASGPFASQRGDSCGCFFLRFHQTGERLKVIVGSGERFAEEIGGDPWDHVSVSCERRIPLWAEMCWIKGLFFTDEECVVQFHPAGKDYINDNPNVLHLWRSCSVAFPMPPKICV